MKNFKIKSLYLCSLLFTICCANSDAQNIRKTLNECVEIALKNNLQIQMADLEIKQTEALRRTAFNLDKIEISYLQDVLTPDWIDKKITVSQNFEFPSVYVARAKLLKKEQILAEKSKYVAENEVKTAVGKAYCNLNFAENNIHFLRRQDSIYQDFVKKTNLREAAGESNILEVINAQTKAEESRLLLEQAEIYFVNCQTIMQKLLNSMEKISTAESYPFKLPEINILNIDTQQIATNPLVSYYEQQIDIKSSQIKVEQNRLLPDIFLGYSFNEVKLPSFEIGLSIPLFFWTSTAKIKAAKAERQKIEIVKQQTLQTLQTDFFAQYGEYTRAKNSLSYYENRGLANAEILQKTAQIAYNQGEIGYLEYIQNQQTAIAVQMQYLTALNTYNQVIIMIEYFIARQNKQMQI